MSLWASVLGSALSLLWSGSVLGLVHKLNIVGFVLLVGVWATLQFRSIYRDEPDVARLLERCLPTNLRISLGGGSCCQGQETKGIWG